MTERTGPAVLGVLHLARLTGERAVAVDNAFHEPVSLETIEVCVAERYGLDNGAFWKRFLGLTGEEECLGVRIAQFLHLGVQRTGAAAVERAS